MSGELHPLAAAWRDRGAVVTDRWGEDLFHLDEPADDPTSDAPPVLLVHGFPTCSFDWRHCWPALRARRRVVALDLPGFGLSSKPDRAHTIERMADAVEAVAAHAGLDEVDLVTHDMGDTVGGELLARDLAGELGFGVRRRVVTNGSVFIDMAQLTDGQQLLLALPDERTEVELPGELYTDGLRSIFGATPPDEDDLDALLSLFSQDDGIRLVARLIRYVEQRRVTERRWTGAVVEHPSPLTIVWGDADPVAVWPMAQRLADDRAGSAQPDATLVRLAGVGHFPMIEAPDATAEAILAALD